METDSSKKTSIQKIFSIIQWASSIFFLVFGIVGMIETIFTGLTMILLGLILFPPIDKKLSEQYKKIKLHPAFAKIIISIVLILFAGSMVPENKINIANELYENTKIEEAIIKLNEINPKNDFEKQTKESLIKKYSADLIIYNQDKNLFFNNRINEEFKKENYEMVIKIFEQVEKNSNYYQTLKPIIEVAKEKVNSTGKIKNIQDNNQIKTDLEIETKIFNSIKILNKEIDDRIPNHKECDLRVSINFYGMNICQKNERDLLFKILENYYRNNNFDEYEIVTIKFYTGKYANNWEKNKTFYNCAIMILPDDKNNVSLDIQSFYFDSSNKHIECDGNGIALDGIRKIKR